MTRTATAPATASAAAADWQADLPTFTARARAIIVTNAIICALLIAALGVATLVITLS
jgi:hypothetical protein